jgi:hypothetical protein
MLSFGSLTINYRCPVKIYLPEPSNYPALVQIIWRELDENLVAGQNPDLVDSHFTGEMPEDDLPALQFDAKNSIRQIFQNFAF